MTDAERGKIRNDIGRLDEGKIAIELQAISRTRDGRALLHDFRNHTTDQEGNVPCMIASTLTSSAV